MIDSFFALTEQERREGIACLPDGEGYCCAVCGKRFEEAEIYPINGHYYRAKQAAKCHVTQEHGSLLECYLGMDSRYVGLTENQKELLRLMGQGLSDSQIAAQMRVTPSTVRHQRFVFREKAKQARLFLALYEIASGKGRKPQDEVIEIHSGAEQLDERFVVTRAEEEKILSLAFSSLSPLKLKHFPVKEKKKVVILERIAGQFSPGKRYTESEVNAILKGIYEDYVTIRRYLIEYGYMDRERDCSFYWRKGEGQGSPEAHP